MYELSFLLFLLGWNEVKIYKVTSKRGMSVTNISKCKKKSIPFFHKFAAYPTQKKKKKGVGECSSKLYLPNSQNIRVQIEVFFRAYTNFK